MKCLQHQVANIGIRKFEFVTKTYNLLVFTYKVGKGKNFECISVSRFKAMQKHPNGGGGENTFSNR